MQEKVEQNENGLNQTFSFFYIVGEMMILGGFNSSRQEGN